MYRILIKGVVQGVGFRPYIYNACVKAGLNGFVQNIGDGVVVEVDDKEKFLEILEGIPILSKIHALDIKDIKAKHKGFSIRESEGKGFAEVPPDLFLCKDCLKELRDNTDRRHNYFFITCTNCGPRFSMTEHSPYDRGTTTMSDFPMCEKCSKEYSEPADRRYHAQTIACHECGPKLTLTSGKKKVSGTDDAPVKAAAELLKEGKVVSIKGVGGFHLATTLDADAVNELRKLTGRKHKPYAVMCRDLEMVRTIAEIDPEQEKLLKSYERPIVVLNKLDSGEFQEVSELDTIGIMLPYTALHYLLFDHIDSPIVMTSSNRSDEPISIEAKQQLSKHILDHSRRIENPVDDSVLKRIGGETLFLRRSRGYVPRSIPLEGTGQFLALGAEMHNTFCVYKNGRAFMSQYMGTTSNATTFKHYKKMVQKMLEFTQVEPEKIIADLHPDYNTSRYAEELAKKLKVPLIRVQHHLAHAYSVAAEHELDEFAAIVCDGLGFGEDKTIWGGEVFSNNERIGHLEQHFQLGGDKATQSPARMLLSILSRFLNERELKEYMEPHFKEKELSILHKQLEEQFNSPLTSSTGRVFDAAAVLLGLCKERTYEGRPAMLLEAHSTEPYHLQPIIEDNVLMTTPLFEYLVKNLDLESGRLAATVQQYVAEGLLTIAKRAKKPIVFSGGCAYSRVMTNYLLEQGVLINKTVPAGDGGISFGQVAYALRSA